MIKINLLPKSINEKKAVRNMAVLFGVLVVAVIAIGVLYTQMVLVPQVQQEQQLVEQTKALETQVINLEGDTSKVQGSMKPISDKLTFVNAVLDYNTKYPKLYEEVAKWTYEKVAYTTMTCDGTQVQMSARARSLDDLGRFLLNMYRATDLFTEVAISGVPGYPTGGANNPGGGPVPQGPSGFGPQANMAGMPAIAAGVMSGPAARYIDFTVSCKLKTPIAAPAFAGAGAAAGAAGTAGAPAVGAPTPMAPPTPVPSGPTAAP